jgi:hypothetical protein
VADLRILRVYAERYLDSQPAEFQRKARDLIAQGKYGMTDRVIYDSQDVEQDAELGDNYVYWVLPEDGPPIELAVVGWSKIATASKELLDAWGRGAPDDASHR